MFSIFRRYTRWLHTQWPSGAAEKLPECDANGKTTLPGVWITGDLKRIPLLKFASKTGADAADAVVKELRGDGKDSANGDSQKPESSEKSGDDLLDLAIIGGGVSGVSAAIVAKEAGLNFAIFETAKPFTTIINFPKGKPIFTYPTEMTLSEGLQLKADVKEELLENLEAQRKEADIEFTEARIEKIELANGELKLHSVDGEEVARARRVIVAIGRGGDHRKLECPGEELDKVYNRLHDPKDFAKKNVLVVGGGDSAMETAIALAGVDAKVTLSYRKEEFSRPKPENVKKLKNLAEESEADSVEPGKVRLLMESEVEKIEQEKVSLKVANGDPEEIQNDAVFTMIGRDAPLSFFRRSGIYVHGDWTVKAAIGLIVFLIFCILLYHFKSNAPEFPVQKWLSKHHTFPFDLPKLVKSLGGNIAALANSKGNILHTLQKSASTAPFYYTLGYSLLILIFGIRRIRRRRTPYIKWQTITLMAVQWIPLFILPEILLPWAGHNGWFEPGHPLRWLADHLFERYDGNLGDDRAYWRSFGFILAFPLNVSNVFTSHPIWLWLVICFVQTFVIIPLIIWRWGKGAYCGWICSCGAMAETMGDAHRQKMPHGPRWNLLNMLGQAVLAFATILLGLRIAGWIMGPKSWPTMIFEKFYTGIPFINYSWSVDLLLAGILGLGLYFWYSGRTWCRFACPLAALMHIYTRFSRYRIFPEKSKCISCNICTDVCHQGIDVMNFANKGRPMEDPECVRCSACVQECPTGVLTFGRYDGAGKIVLDKMSASPVQMREKEDRG